MAIASPSANVSDERPAPRRLTLLERTRRTHWTFLLMAIVVLALAAAMRVRDDQRVELQVLPGLPVPETCLSRSWLGVPCPGCGLTRSFIHLCHGRWAEAYAVQRVGWVFLAALILQIPFRIYGLYQLRRDPPRLPNDRGSLHWTNLFSAALIALLVGNWLLQQIGW